MQGQLFSKKTQKESKSVLYRVSQNRFSERHLIQSENFGMLSLACRVVLSRTKSILTMRKFLLIINLTVKGII